MKTLLVTAVAVVCLLAVAVLLLGVKALFVKGGKFPSGHAHDLPRRQRLAREALEQRRAQKRAPK